MKDFDHFFGKANRKRIFEKKAMPQFKNILFIT